MTTPTLPEIRAMAERLLEMERKMTPGLWRRAEKDPDCCLDEHGFITAKGLSTPTLDGRSLNERASDQAEGICQSRNAIRPLCAWLIAMIDAVEQEMVHRPVSRGDVFDCAAELVREREKQ